MAFFLGTKTNGRFKLKSQQSWNLWLDQFPDGTLLRLEIDRYDKHTNQQRKWFHWVCRYIAKHTSDHTEADVKVAMKGLHLPALFDETGEPRIGQTRRLNKEDYSLLIDQTIQWAAEKMELVVPDPRPQVEVDMEELRSVQDKKKGSK
jgi:hypothetical protein